MTLYKDHFYCPDLDDIDQEERFLWQNWNSDSASVLILDIEADPSWCLGKPDDYQEGDVLTADDFDERTNNCNLSREGLGEIDYTYFVLLTNNQRFVDKAFHPDDPVVSESVLNWLSFPNNPTRWFFDIKQTELIYDDSYVFSLTGITDTIREIFSVQISEKEAVNARNYFMMAQIVVQMDLDWHKIERTVFNFQNVLSDIGGLARALQFSFAVVVTLANLNMAHNFVASRLYESVPNDLK